MIRGYKYQLDLNEKQKEFFEKSFGCARYVYNRALSRRIEVYEKTKEKLSCTDLIKEMTFWKKEEERIWLNEIANVSLQQSIRNMDSAFTKFFRQKTGFPEFKKKGHRDSCKFISCVHFDFEKQKVKIPIIGLCNFFCDRGWIGKQGTTTVSKNAAGKYFISVLVDTQEELPKKPKIDEWESVGIDLGIKEFATLSSGEMIANPKYLEKSEKRLKVLQRRLSKKQKGSNRRNKAKLAVAKYHYKVANQRKDFLHKLSTKIIRENQTIVLEDLNVEGMMKNHKLAKAIGSVSWSEFTRQLEYKANWYGKNIIYIGRFEPSSKLCSNCGWKNIELKLSDRVWQCKECGIDHDRDVNAAINIKKFGLIPQNLIGHSGRESASENTEVLQQQTVEVLIYKLYKFMLASPGYLVSVMEKIQQYLKN